VPVVVPLGLAPETQRALYDRLDGLLLAGGGDVAPARYGAGPHPAVAGVSAERDETELALARWAAAEGKPLLGICRGAQVLNVALGGTLYADLSEHPGALRHTYLAAEGGFELRAHPVAVSGASRLGRLLGGPAALAVNSLHHQACRALAPGLVAAAVAPDGVVEAVELPEHPFALAVQWHPECLAAEPESVRLFAGLVAASAEKG
jgi:putative glutamine amidotransferase